MGILKKRDSGLLVGIDKEYAEELRREGREFESQDDPETGETLYFLRIFHKNYYGPRDPWDPEIAIRFREWVADFLWGIDSRAWVAAALIVIVSIGSYTGAKLWGIQNSQTPPGLDGEWSRVVTPTLIAVIVPTQGTSLPTSEPTEVHTQVPTEALTQAATQVLPPTLVPTQEPTASPTEVPLPTATVVVVVEAKEPKPPHSFTNGRAVYFYHGHSMVGIFPTHDSEPISDALEDGNEPLEVLEMIKGSFIRKWLTFVR